MENFNVSYWEKNRDQCLQLLSQCDFINKIPLLDDIDYHEYENKLVRFRGMVQDTLNPVYYLEKCQVFNPKTGAYAIRSGKYRDFIPCEEDEEIMLDSAENQHQEKYVMHCVKIPALNSWTHQFKYSSDQDIVSTRNEKRKLDVTDDTMEVDSGDSSKKLATEVTDVSVQQAVQQEAMNCDDTIPAPSAERLPELVMNNSSSCHSCLLNFYGDREPSVKLNDVIEVVGFLSSGAIPSESLEEASSAVSSLPRIHVIHTNPDASSFSSILQNDKEHVLLNAQALRDELWIMLTDILAGDTLAADYLLCNLISSVYSRQEMLALGKFSLNLSNVPFNLCNSEYVKELYKFLSHLLEKSHLMPITIQYLNSTTMIPKKNNDENRLVSGVLQMSSNTHLVIDETRLEAGKLIDKGVRNVQALADIITNQKLDYDFEFYPIPFQTDIPVLTLSEGKSLLPSDCRLIMDPDKSCMENIDEAFSRTWKKMSDPLLSKLRIYLNNISSLKYELSADMQQIIQEDFVRMRQEDSKVNADDLHMLLVLARLISLSRGSNSLNKTVWDYACLLEKRRKERLH